MRKEQATAGINKRLRKSVDGVFAERACVLLSQRWASLRAYTLLNLWSQRSGYQQYALYVWVLCMCMWPLTFSAFVLVGVDFQFMFVSV